MKKIYFVILVLLLASDLKSQNLSTVPNLQITVDDSLQANKQLKVSIFNKLFGGVIKFLPDIVQDTADVITKNHGMFRWQRKDSVTYVYDTIGYKRWRPALGSVGASYVPTSRTISTTSPLTGGGDLSANRTIGISQATTSTNGYLNSTDWNTFNNKQAALVSGTNIKTINGSSVLGSGDFVVSGTIGLSSADTIYLLWTGQSNAGGFNLGDYDTTSNPKVQAWNTVTNTWVILRRGQFPMGTYTPGVSWSTGGFGPSHDTAAGSFFYFAKRLQERTGVFIRVFMFSWGSNTINNWIPAGSTNFSTITSEIAAAGSPHISFMAWMQGESDESTMVDTTYKAKVDTLVQQLDAQTWFGKDVPIFVITCYGGSGTLFHRMNHVQKAYASGLYDKRYTLIDATDEPDIGDHTHFTAQAQYNIGNKIIQTLFNKDITANSFRLADSTEREKFVTHTPNLKKGLVLRDTTGSYKGFTFFMQPIFMNNGSNSLAAVLATTDNQVAKLTSNSGNSTTADQAGFSIQHEIGININAALKFINGNSSTNGYAAIYTSGTEKVRFANNGDVDITTGRLTVPFNSSNTAINAGSIGIQPFAVNNGFIAENAKYNSGFVYVANGKATLEYLTGDIDFQTAPNGSAGAAATFTSRFFIKNTGEVGVGTGSPSTYLDINGDKFRVRTEKTPSSASDTGNKGDICWDASYIYICTATNTWKRVAITTW
jgi:hypothetical protein